LLSTRLYSSSRQLRLTHFNHVANKAREHLVLFDPVPALWGFPLYGIGEAKAYTIIIAKYRRHLQGTYSTYTDNDNLKTYFRQVPFLSSRYLVVGTEACLFRARGIERKAHFVASGEYDGSEATQFLNTSDYTIKWVAFALLLDEFFGRPAQLATRTD